MAGSPTPVDAPKLGIKATIAGLVFVLAILAGFGAATAASYEDRSSDYGDDYGEEYGDDHSDDDYSDDDHSDDDHSDE